MKPIQFKEANCNLLKPKGMTDEECVDLPVFKDGEQIISKWKLTQREIDNVINYGYIWIRVISAETHPPILPEAEYTIFVNPS